MQAISHKIPCRFYFTEPACPSGSYDHGGPLTEGRSCFGTGELASFTSATCGEADQGKLQKRWTPGNRWDAYLFSQLEDLDQESFFLDARTTGGKDWLVGGSPPLNDSDILTNPGQNGARKINVRRYQDTSLTGDWAPTPSQYPENVTGELSLKMWTKILQILDSALKLIFFQMPVFR